MKIMEKAKVFYTKNIDSESLVKIYEAVQALFGIEPHKIKVVKMKTG